MVSYGDDIDHVKLVITDIVESHQLALNDPMPVIGVNKHAESSIDYILKVWCTKDDYWIVHHDLQKDIKKSFDKNDITILFPQGDVHYFNQQLVD